MLQATNVIVAYGKREILHGVDFDARPGEVTAIVGPNGSGKTTLLRALSGDVSYTGTIWLDEREVSGSRPWELAALRGVLPQATALAFPFTVLEVVRLGLRRGLEASEAGLVLRALERVGLSGYEGRLYQELSGGEQQRVQLARVLCQVWHPVLEGQAHWLFLDEPVSSLDIGHQLQVMQIARDYAARGGGVVAVMHDLNLTAIYAGSVALISDGLVQAQDKPQQVLQDELL
ncbi:MAG: heme ABC transporter ATP-binding protein, partial [Pseudomonadota bacterium]